MAAIKLMVITEMEYKLAKKSTSLSSRRTFNAKIIAVHWFCVSYLIVKESTISYQRVRKVLFISKQTHSKPPMKSTVFDVKHFTFE